MPTIEDSEFGSIALRRTTGRHVRFSLAPNGALKISAPKLMPAFMVKRAISDSRSKIRTLIDHHPRLDIRDGMPIGKKHYLVVKEGDEKTVSRHGTQIILTIPRHSDPSEAAALVRPYVIKTLRREAKEYLPKRLENLARTYGYTYSSVRFSHASTRWGSCSSRGVISLNIALMNLPNELIDYVLIHELAHTAQMNHSPSFWNEVARMDDDYMAHRKWIKNHSPAI